MRFRDSAIRASCARSSTTGRVSPRSSKHAGDFTKVSLFTIDEVFGGWGKAQPKHFGDGGTFDEIYQPK